MVFGITRGKEAWLKSYKLLVEMLHEIGVLKLATRKICYQFLKKKREVSCHLHPTSKVINCSEQKATKGRTFLLISLRATEMHLDHLRRDNVKVPT